MPLESAGIIPTQIATAPFDLVESRPPESAAPFRCSDRVTRVLEFQFDLFPDLDIGLGRHNFFRRNDDTEPPGLDRVIICIENSHPGVGEKIWKLVGFEIAALQVQPNPSHINNVRRGPLRPLAFLSDQKWLD
jgi:hypothetical protein